MSDQPRLPRVVFVLAAGTFMLGTTEFMIAGLLPEIAAAMHVSIAHAGLLITAFALGMIVGAPVMGLATRRIPKRTTLVAALAVFAVGHVVAAVSDSFAIVLASRFVTALATGAFWSVAAVVATRAAGPTASARALAVVMGGLTLANVIGVPAGTLLGHLTGWRGPFWVLAAVSALGALVIARLIPADDQDRETHPVTMEFAALRQTPVWLALSCAALIMGGVIGTYTYITPLLTHRAGLSLASVPLVLIGFGAGALLGTILGGRFGDQRPLGTAIVASAATAVVLLLLAIFSRNAVAAVILIGLMGLFGFAVNPVVTSLAVRFAGHAPTLTAALSVSSFNVGNAVGSALAASRNPAGELSGRLSRGWPRGAGHPDLRADARPAHRARPDRRHPVHPRRPAGSSRSRSP